MLIIDFKNSQLSNYGIYDFEAI